MWLHHLTRYNSSKAEAICPVFPPPRMRIDFRGTYQRDFPGNGAQGDGRRANVGRAVHALPMLRGLGRRIRGIWRLEWGHWRTN